VILQDNVEIFSPQILLFVVTNEELTSSPDLFTVE